MVRKLLRNAGLALIFLPEPFTTPIGLALLGASYVFAHFSRIDTPDYLRGFIKLYLKEASVRGRVPGVVQHKLNQKLASSEWTYRPEKNVRRGIDTSRLLLRFGKDMAIEFTEPATPVQHDIKQRWAGYVWPGVSPDIHSTPTASHIIDTSHLSVRFLEDACGGSRKPLAKTINHTVDITRLSRLGDTARPVADKAIHHSMKHDLYGYVLSSIPLHEESAVVHDLNSDRLSRLCEHVTPSAVSDKTTVHILDRGTQVASAHHEKEAVHFHAFNPAKVSLALGMG